MDQLKFYFSLGLDHVLDIQAYDHILFLTALVVSYLFKDLKKIFWLVTTFTIGHTTSLLLATYGIIRINENLVEFLIPITIFVTALYNIFSAGKSNRDGGFWVLIIITLFFGIIHGLGFSGYFRQIIAGQDEKLLPILEFALGIETAQLIIVLIVLLLSSLSEFIFRFNSKEWILVASAIVLGMCIPMILERV